MIEGTYRQQRTRLQIELVGSRVETVDNKRHTFAVIIFVRTKSETAIVYERHSIPFDETRVSPK